MTAPPRDDDGHVLPHDDPDIRDDDGLLRYINPDNHVYWDKNLSTWRLASSAFSETSRSASPNGGMSVDVERLKLADGHSPDSNLEPDWGVVRLITGKLRQSRMMVGSDPLPSNLYHALVWNPDPKPGKKLKIQDRYSWIRKARNIE